MEEVFMKVGEDADADANKRFHDTPIDVAMPPNDRASVQIEEEEAPVQIEQETPTKTLITLTYKYTPNSGVILWLQQFWAMFLKRIYNSARFWGAVVSQLLLPLGFILFALILSVTSTNQNADDPKRSLELRTSSLSQDNVSLFFANFGGTDGLNFSDMMPSQLNATNIFNFTSEVQSIIGDVAASPPTNTADCCQYNYQLLDGFCAAKTAGELTATCEGSDGFGYHKCTHCLGCCDATSFKATARTCSTPSSLLTGSKNNENFCPSPPKVSIDAIPSGPLESENTFIAEYLLRLSVQLQPTTFFRDFQAGFTMANRDPVFSVCGCNSESSGQACDFFSPLQPDNVTATCPDYSFSDNCALLWNLCLNNLTILGDPCEVLSSPFLPNCANLSSTGGNICYSNQTLPSCYTMNGLSADVLKEKACNDKRLVKGCNSFAQGDRPVSASYKSQDSEAAVTVWYSNQPYHMPGAALNAFHNILLRNLTGDTSYTITVNNHPLPRNVTVQLEDASNDLTGFGIGILVVFGFSFLLASFVLFLVKEKETKAKHLQFVSGVFPSSYWLSTFAWDLLNALVPVIISLILFAAFQVEAFTGEALGAIFLLLMLTCWSSIPFAYVFSFLFTNALAAFGLLVLMFFFVAMLTSVVVTLVAQNVGNDEADIIHYIFLIFPTYGLSAAFNDLYLNQVAKKVCTQFGGNICANNTQIRYVDNPFDFERPGIGTVLVYMFVEGFLLLFLTLLLERNFFFPEIRSFLTEKISNRKNRFNVTSPLIEDEDVSEERRKVANYQTNENDVIILNNLQKTYRGRLSGCTITPSKSAVRGISLAIPTGECFGLLGVNGAGKTTTFSIITGDLSMTSGSVTVAGYDIANNLRDVQQRIGYCPQFDALIERLTGRELLTMFARLRGVPESQIKEVVDTEITRVDLKKHANKKCGSYSGGNKRKLSTAIALVGNPPIVLLDEPTTGMDPTTRRYTWDVLTNVIKEGRSIILTSHSMEECEALCTRIAIMVNGSFKCLGSIQHLKNKFGTGFILQVRVGAKVDFKIANAIPDREQTVIVTTGSSKSGFPDPGSINLETTATPSIHSFVRESFSGALLLEEHQGSATYQLPSGAASWSSVFRLLEKNKERLHIQDYAVSQTTLEQVFINFAKEQQDND